MCVKCQAALLLPPAMSFTYSCACKDQIQETGVYSFLTVENDTGRCRDEGGTYHWFSVFCQSLRAPGSLTYIQKVLVSLTKI